ncbi:hypothetical protein SELMODRAFT_441834 [Selaginella moellendorffii]|uniref:Cell division control protein n=1 Tax=Selaginella moellendorffii TaxID=88036 RepID=D8RMY7_SELML|nr:cell division control protein 6 homolog B [Selaginella moellendorffii]EFJ26619.1 hypothetical protein SELMODRAFT_441834 [Selaginella moellendorffii]|eukprot:XP_002972533.1 cell division control protein 6 homolog B [Selaginella moellendorffii]
MDFSAHILAAKTALHLSAVPEAILCRSEQIDRIIKFSKDCLLERRPGSLYVCGCPGTGKSLAMEKLKGLLSQWAVEAGVLPPDVASINCTTLTDATQIYSRIYHSLQPGADDDRSVGYQQLKKLLSFNRGAKKMQLLIIDEMDYLITREQTVLYELFQLSVLKDSSCILIGIANAIDLTERFLPRLRTFSCNPDVITFPAYTKDQIFAVLLQRLSSLSVATFHPAALELCARRVSAASGDMRKALYACRTALDLFEAENKSKSTEPEATCLQRDQFVQVDHMARALAKVFRSPVIETIQALPKHSQMVLCSAVSLFRKRKRDAPLGELNKQYLGFCKTTGMRPVSSQEFSGICQLIADQGLLGLSTAREDRLRKTKLQVDHDDVVFALQGVRFFRNSLL